MTRVHDYFFKENFSLLRDLRDSSRSVAKPTETTRFWSDEIKKKTDKNTKKTDKNL